MAYIRGLMVLCLPRFHGSKFLPCFKVIEIQLRISPCCQKCGACRTEGWCQCLPVFVYCVDNCRWCVMPDLDDSWGIWKNIERGNIISALLPYEKDKKKKTKNFESTTIISGSPPHWPLFCFCFTNINQSDSADNIATFPVKYHIDITWLLLQLSCSNTCHIWMWFKSWNTFTKAEISLTGKLGKVSFSIPQPR